MKHKALSLRRSCRLVVTVALALTCGWASRVGAQRESAFSPTRIGFGGPAPERTPKRNLFGQFVGRWTVREMHLAPDGTWDRRSGLWEFGWVLQGAAIQDVFVLWDDADTLHTVRNAQGYGTTIRVPDPISDEWHVVWASATSGQIEQFVAKAEGNEIVLEGKDPGGGLSRWVFSDMTPDTFHWRSLASSNGGRTWVTEQTMVMQREVSSREKCKARAGDIQRTTQRHRGSYLTGASCQP